MFGGGRLSKEAIMQFLVATVKMRLSNDRPLHNIKEKH